MMTRDGRKQVFGARRQTTKKHWRGLVAMLSIAILISFVGGVVYKKMAAAGQAPAWVTAWATKFSALLAHKKSNKPLANKEKQLAKNKSAQPEALHFEFYTSLPNAQMESTETIEDDKPIPRPAEVVPAVAVAAATQAKEIFSHEDLEQDMQLSTTKSSKVVNATPSLSNYVIQLGVFEEQRGASRLRLALSEAGFTTTVIKTSRGQRTLYRVQQGPYPSLVQARIAQQQLQKRGITCVIYRDEGVNNDSDQA